MRKLSLIFAFLGIVLNLGAQSSPLIEIYTAAGTEDERLGIMRRILENGEVVPQDFYVTALNELLARQVDRGTPQELEKKYQLAKLIIQGFGDNPPLISSVPLWTFYEEVKDPVLRGIALGAFSKIESTDRISKLIRILIRLNQSATKTRNEEILAYSAIQALAGTGSPEGFETLFAASKSWYSPFSKVKELAASSLEQLEGDVSEGLINIIVWSLDFEAKTLALESLTQGNHSQEKKIQGAKVALEQGLKWQPGNDKEIYLLARLRLLALDTLKAQGDRDPEVVPLIQRSYLKAFDTSEQLRSLEVLGINGTNESVQVLTEILRRLNDKNKTAGLPEQEQSQVRQIITSLGMTKNPNARTGLMEIEFSLYTPAIVRESKKALETLPR
ncbi:MAG: hypothetical protein A2Z96_07150 [Spirochaetes bacterium GWB1_48_6]|nr:MAG: hypothetical protein A2Z96_07150 [Spirochaetes bacterium GWB1_48_6]